MKTTKLMLASALAAACSATVYVAVANAATSRSVPADRALSGVPMSMTPDQLPNQFRTQLRGDVKSSRGTAVLRRKGNDVAYTFSWNGMTSSVISGHFHTAPQGLVGVRGYSICGVATESPPCPTGKKGSISGSGRTPISPPSSEAISWSPSTPGPSGSMGEDRRRHSCEKIAWSGPLAVKIVSLVGQPTRFSVRMRRRGCHRRETL